MVARTRLDAPEVVIALEREGETVRITAPKDKALLRAVALLLACRDLQVGDRLSIVDEGPPEVSRASHYSGA
jgi:hypothetical protein